MNISPLLNYNILFNKNNYSNPQKNISTLPMMKDQVSFSSNTVGSKQLNHIGHLNHVEKVFEEAKAYIQKRLATGEKGVVVLDIDDTVLAYNRLFSWVDKEFATDKEARKYAESRKEKSNAAGAFLPAIPKAKEFVKWLGDNKIGYIFVTSRLDIHKDMTIKNLIAEGLVNNSLEETHFLKKNNSYQYYKQEVFEKLSNKKDVLAYIGDTKTDFPLERDKFDDLDTESYKKRPDCFNVAYEPPLQN